MEANDRVVGAAKAKAHFLALLDEVEEKREPVIITKNGRPVARMLPMPLVSDDPIFGFYQGKLEIVGDVLSRSLQTKNWMSLKRVPSCSWRGMTCRTDNASARYTCGALGRTNAQYAF